MRHRIFAAGRDVDGVVISPGRGRRENVGEAIFVGEDKFSAVEQRTSQNGVYCQLDQKQGLCHLSF